MKDWVRLLDASYEAHICKLDHKDCKVLADDIRALLREEETARKEIAELKKKIKRLQTFKKGIIKDRHEVGAYEERDIKRERTKEKERQEDKYGKM
jgi:hypothetical protein